MKGYIFIVWSLVRRRYNFTFSYHVKSTDCYIIFCISMWFRLSLVHKYSSRFVLKHHQIMHLPSARETKFWMLLRVLITAVDTVSITEPTGVSILCCGD